MQGRAGQAIQRPLCAQHAWPERCPAPKGLESCDMASSAQCGALHPSIMNACCAASCCGPCCGPCLYSCPGMSLASVLACASLARVVCTCGPHGQCLAARRDRDTQHVPSRRRPTAPFGCSMLVSISRFCAALLARAMSMSWVLARKTWPHCTVPGILLMPLNPLAPSCRFVCALTTHGRTSGAVQPRVAHVSRKLECAARWPPSIK